MNRTWYEKFYKIILKLKTINIQEVEAIPCEGVNNLEVHEMKEGLATTRVKIDGRNENAQMIYVYFSAHLLFSYLPFFSRYMPTRDKLYSVSNRVIELPLCRLYVLATRTSVSGPRYTTLAHEPQHDTKSTTLISRYISLFACLYPGALQRLSRN